jgi:hypothetical protein
MPTDRYIASHLAMAGDYVPVAPADWPPERRARFDKLAKSRPAGWWTPANEGLLVEFVLAAEQAERLQAALDLLDVEGLDLFASFDELNRLLMARDREAKRLLALARTMRLTQLSLPPRREGSDSPSDPASAPWAC